MPIEKSAEPPLPAGWLSEFISKADLSASYDALSASTHFYAETMRGRIRALQLRLHEAADHFERAEDLFMEAPRTTPNLLRGFLLGIYTFDCILLCGPLDPELASLQSSIPELPAQVLEEHPEVRLAIEYRKAVEALFCLHLGETDRALDLYNELLENNTRGDTEQVARYHIGLAAAQHNLGYGDACLESLECAGLCLQAGTNLLPQTQVAAILLGVYRYLGLENEARSWQFFLDRLPCPVATKDALLRRGEMSTRRSIEIARLVFL
jgi:hypothetical protein